MGRSVLHKISVAEGRKIDHDGNHDESGSASLEACDQAPRHDGRTKGGQIRRCEEPLLPLRCMERVTETAEESCKIQGKAGGETAGWENNRYSRINLSLSCQVKKK